MLRKFCRSKIYNARITFKQLEYEGSITIDAQLMELAEITEGEIVAVLNINNGARFETYVIKGDRGSGVVGLNGAAARLGEVGDKVIIFAFGYLSPEETEDFSMRRLHVDDNNRPQ